jgi:hypothetical protein
MVSLYPCVYVPQIKFQAIEINLMKSEILLHAALSAYVGYSASLTLPQYNYNHCYGTLCISAHAQLKLRV